MRKVYIVMNKYYYDGCCSDVANVNDAFVEKVFDSEEKAINYIIEEIKDSLNRVAEDDPFREYLIDHIPTADDFDDKYNIEYCYDRKEKEHYSYSICEYCVE